MRLKLPIMIVWSLGFFLTCPLTASSRTPDLQVAKPHYVQSQAVGNLSAAFSVNGNGSATAEISIQVPPGTKGVAPQLSVSYDSHQGNGYLGMGWALKGLSSITRCSANYRLDGYKASVNYDSRDRYCIDGRRLVVVIGQYGEDGSVYHTESETWTILTAHGSCGEGPCSFSATNKDGDTLSFGATTGATGSRILASGLTDGSVRTWSIDRFADLNGNSTTAEYYSDTAIGEYYPTRIAYTENSAASLSAGRFVTFAYSDRTDIVRRYLGGSKVAITKLLSSVETSVMVSGQPQPILKYALSYSLSPATDRSRLDQVQVCDGSDVCWPATQFDWSDDAQKFKPSTTKLPGPSYVVVDGQQYIYGILRDFNGDGIADYSQATEFIINQGVSQDLSIYLGQADGSFEKASYVLPGPVFLVTSTAVVQSGILLDINGDGILDYSRALKNDDSSSEDLDVYIGSKTGFKKDGTFKLPGPLFLQVDQQTFATGVLLDMNGDGLPDYSRATKLLSSGQEILEIYKGTTSGFEITASSLPGPVYSISPTASLTTGMVRDINGDGIADYSAALVNATAKTSDLKVYVGQSPDFTFTYEFDLPGQMFWFSNGAILESGLLTDVNGDGIPDYSRATNLVAESTKLTDLYFGTGKGFEKAPFDLPDTIYSIAGNVSEIQGLLTDWNGDETTRFSKATRWRDGTKELAVFLGSGTGFKQSSLSLPDALFWVLDEGTYSRAVYQDINGDSLTDFADSVCQMKEGVPDQCDLGIQLAEGPFTDLLTHITNGFKGETIINYAPLTRDGLYVSGDLVEYPMRAQEVAVYVVESYSNLDGRGNTYGFSYTYSGAKTDLIGAGWIGFETVTMTEAANGRSSKVTYNQVYPNYGLVEDSKVTDGKGNLLTESNFEYVDVSPSNLQQLGLHQLLRSKETVTHYTENVADYTLEKDYTYDSYGNILIVSDLGDTSSPDDDVFYCTRFFNNETQGRFGYWLQTKTIRTFSGCQDFVNVPDPGSIAWNASSDLRWHQQTFNGEMNVNSSTQYDDSNSVFLSRIYTYDSAVGNLQTATDYAGNVTTYTYDAVFQTFQTTVRTPTLTHASTGQAYQLVTLTKYEPGFGMLVESTDPNGNVESYSIDGFGRITAVYGPDAATGLAATQLAAATWQEDKGAFYLYSQQRPAWDSSTLADWYWQKDYRDGLGRDYLSKKKGLVNSVPTDIIAVEIVFDEEGRVFKSATPYYQGDSAPFLSTEYDVYNRPKRITHPNGRVDTLTYEQGGLQITRVEGEGADARTYVKTLNARGFTTQTIEPNKRTVNYIYNPINELLSADIVQEARSSVYTYDSLGRTLTATHTDSGTTTTSYSTDGYLQSTTNASGSNVQYAPYDALGRLLKRVMTDDSGSSTFVKLAYDDPGSTNSLGRVTNILETQEVTGEFSYVYGYDAYGETTTGSMTINGDQYSYASAYDSMGRVISETYPNGAVLERSYLSDGNLGALSLKARASADVTEYANYSNHTALRQVLTASYNPINLTFKKSYYPAGPAYSSLQSYQTQQANGNKLLDMSYGWDEFFSLTKITDLSASGSSSTYSYNDQSSNKGMGYLTSATGASGSPAFSYDDLGNIQDNNGVTYTYKTGTDQTKTGSDGSSYSYDSNGNMTSSSISGVSTMYAYDAEGRLLKTATGSGKTAQMAYNHTGDRVFHQPLNSNVKTWSITPYYEVAQLTDSSYQNTLYIPGPEGLVATITESGKNNLFVLPGTTGKLASFLKKAGTLFSKNQFYFGVLPIIIVVLLASILWKSWRGRKMNKVTATLVIASMLTQVTVPAAWAALSPGANGAGIPTTGTLFYVHDHLGSVVTVLNGTGGGVTASVAYDVYGAIDQANSSGSDNFRLKFIESELDPEAGLYHMGARYYSPALTRFISPDPLKQFASPYIYAGNNPVSASDPNGEFALMAALIIGAVGAVVGAYFGASEVNHDMNPTHWNWKSGKTYAGLLGGGTIGAVGAAAGGLAVEAGAAIGASGGLAAEAASTAIGIAGEAVVGAGENAAFTAMGGGSDRQILDSAGVGALLGVAFATAGMAAGARFGSASVASEEGEETIARMTAAGEAGEVEMGGCASFTENTEVSTEKGSKDIEDIDVGDKVWSYDEETRKTRLRPVSKLFTRIAAGVIAVTLGEATVEATPEHPFYLPDEGWVQARDIDIGDKVLQLDGTLAQVTALQAHYGDVRVYNFEVAETHNYYVSDEEVLAHNPCSGNNAKEQAERDSQWDHVWISVQEKGRPNTMVTNCSGRGYCAEDNALWKLERATGRTYTKQSEVEFSQAHQSRGSGSRQIGPCSACKKSYGASLTTGGHRIRNPAYARHVSYRTLKPPIKRGPGLKTKPKHPKLGRR